MPHLVRRSVYDSRASDSSAIGSSTPSPRLAPDGSAIEEAGREMRKERDLPA